MMQSCCRVGDEDDEPGSVGPMCRSLSLSTNAIGCLRLGDDFSLHGNDVMSGFVVTWEWHALVDRIKSAQEMMRRS
ncbi:hypothetical protein M758_12G022500 [Ceratodon purpureus]|nr:hypothetical protein M758_12G022500 [Ceratodon purpureus]